MKPRPSLPSSAGGLVLAAVALIAWGAFRFFSATQRQLKAAAARTQAADKSA